MFYGGLCMLLKSEIGALILRVTLGLTFFIHGLVKFQDGIENTVGWFTSIGLPGFLAYGVASLELIGGILLMIGLATRLVSALFVLLMVGATIKVKLAIGFLGNGQMAGYELDVAFIAMAFYLFLNGSKLYSVGHGLVNRKKESEKLTKFA
jgi:putative oxidoreductase